MLFGIERQRLLLFIFIFIFINNEDYFFNEANINCYRIHVKEGHVWEINVKYRGKMGKKYVIESR